MSEYRIGILGFFIIIAEGFVEDITNLSDASLLSLHKKEYGGGAAPAECKSFDEVLRRYEKLVYHIARTYFQNAEDAKDAGQDVAIKIYNNLHRVAIADDGNLKAWIATVTARTCLDALRKKRPQTIELNADIYTNSVESAEDAVVAKEKAEQILAAIKKLPGNHRMIIILRDMKGLSYDELAAALSINIGTVKSQLSRARAGLKKMLE